MLYPHGVPVVDDQQQSRISRLERQIEEHRKRIESLEAEARRIKIKGG